MTQRLRLLRSVSSSKHLVTQREYYGSVLQMGIGVLFPDFPLAVMTSDFGVGAASALLARHGTDFGLVQDSPDTIQGVIRMEVLNRLQTDVGFEERGTRVGSLMDRRICIEPDSATLGEVLNRLAISHCPCAVIVDRLGRPSFIVSPEMALDVLEAGLAQTEEIKEAI